jgi:hypothetical protein
VSCHRALPLGPAWQRGSGAPVGCGLRAAGCGLRNTPGPPHPPPASCASLASMWGR